MAGFSIILLMTPFLVLGTAISVFVILILLAIVVYFLYAYIMETLFLLRVRSNAGEKYKALAWIPFYKQYLLGKIAGRPKLGVAVALCYLGMILLCLLPNVEEQYLGYILLAILVLAVMSFVLKSMICHKIYQMASAKHYDLFTALGVILLGIPRPAFLFALRNKVHKKEENNL